MAIQVIGDEVHLLPAWPAEWSLQARFSVPGNRFMTIRYTPGTEIEYELEGSDLPEVKIVKHLTSSNSPSLAP